MSTRRDRSDARGEFLLSVLHSGRRVVLRKFHNAERMEMVVFMPDGEVVYDVTPTDTNGAASL